MKISYSPEGVCSSSIDIQAEDGIIISVDFTGGCNGNLQGISALLQGMEISEAISKLSGIKCGHKMTSCPDQLSKALMSLA